MVRFIALQQNLQLSFEFAILVLDQVLLADPLAVHHGGVAVVEDDLEEGVLVGELPQRDGGLSVSSQQSKWEVSNYLINRLFFIGVVPIAWDSRFTLAVDQIEVLALTSHTP